MKSKALALAAWGGFGPLRWEWGMRGLLVLPVLNALGVAVALHGDIRAYRMAMLLLPVMSVLLAGVLLYPVLTRRGTLQAAAGLMLVSQGCNGVLSGLQIQRITTAPDGNPLLHVFDADLQRWTLLAFVSGILGLMLHLPFRRLRWIDTGRIIADAFVFSSSVTVLGALLVPRWVPILPPTQLTQTYVHLLLIGTGNLFATWLIRTRFGTLGGSIARYWVVGNALVVATYLVQLLLLLAYYHGATWRVMGFVAPWGMVCQWVYVQAIIKYEQTPPSWYHTSGAPMASRFIVTWRNPVRVLAGCTLAALVLTDRAQTITIDQLVWLISYVLWELAVFLEYMVVTQQQTHADARAAVATQASARMLYGFLHDVRGIEVQLRTTLYHLPTQRAPEVHATAGQLLVLSGVIELALHLYDAVPAPVDLLAVTAQAATDLAPETHAYGCTVLIDCSHSQLRLSSDARVLYAATHLLIIHSLYAAPAARAVVITLTPAPLRICYAVTTQGAPPPPPQCRIMQILAVRHGGTMDLTTTPDGYQIRLTITELQ